MSPSKSVGYAAEVLADGPKAYWRATAAVAATTEVDIAGSHTGTYTGVVTMQQGSPLTNEADSAVLYAGGSMSCVHNADIMFTTAFTMEYWAKSSSSFGTNRYVVSKSDANVPGDGGYGVFRPTGGNLKAFYSTGAAFKVGTDSTFNPWDGEWHHVVATFDGTNLVLTIDKVIRANDSLAGTVGANAVVFRIGDIPSLGFPMTATIDEVALYNTVLSPSRIIAHYNAASASGKPTQRSI